MAKLETSITIAASQEQVWRVLMDFAAYPQWNPFIYITGEARVGARLKNTITLEGRPPQTFRPKVLAVETGREFRWLGNLFFPGLFDGEHYFILEPVDEHTTRLIHGERFRGIFVRPILKMIGAQTEAGFHRMNAALKERVEVKGGKSAAQ